MTQFIFIHPFQFIYFAGIASCAIQGSNMSPDKNNPRTLILAILTAFGGGIFRDMLLLSVFPVVLTKACLPDILLAISTGLINDYFSQKTIQNQKTNWLIILTDGAGLGTFISIGIDKALSLGAGQTLAFFCGIATALGGGITSSLLSGFPFHKVLTSNIPYRLITILGAFSYLYWLNSGIEKTNAQLLLVVYTSITCFGLTVMHSKNS